MVLEDRTGNDLKRGHTQVSVVVGKGKKRVLASFDADGGDRGKQEIGLVHTIATSK